MRLTEWTREEQEPLIHFMTTNVWPYHVQSHPGRELIEKAIEEGGYESDDVKTFWVENDEYEKVGIVQLYDVQDEVPVFDLRIAEKWRGYGYGVSALHLLTDYVFQLPGEKMRIEGHTRQDNVAMRRTFERVGYVKEAHFRKAWYMPKEDRYYDAVTYGMTREDFLKGTSTPVIWDDKEPIKTDYREFAQVLDVIESETLEIRIPKMTDVEAMHDSMLRSAKYLKQYMHWAQQKPTIEKVEERIRGTIADFVTRKALTMHIFKKDTEEFMGCISLLHIDWHVPKFEIGYWIDERFEGQGYLYEAVMTMKNYAFNKLLAKRVEIRCDRDNIRSREVAERIGFELEGILKQDSLKPDGRSLRDICVYAKIKTN